MQDMKKRGVLTGLCGLALAMGLTVSVAQAQDASPAAEANPAGGVAAQLQKPVVKKKKAHKAPKRKLAEKVTKTAEKEKKVDRKGSAAPEPRLGAPREIECDKANMVEHHHYRCDPSQRVVRCSSVICGATPRGARAGGRGAPPRRAM